MASYVFTWCIIHAQNLIRLFFTAIESINCILIFIVYLYSYISKCHDDRFISYVSVTDKQNNNKKSLTNFSNNNSKFLPYYMMLPSLKQIDLCYMYSVMQACKQKNQGQAREQKY